MTIPVPTPMEDSTALDEGIVWLHVRSVILSTDPKLYKNARQASLSMLCDMDRRSKATDEKPAVVPVSGITFSDAE